MTTCIREQSKRFLAGALSDAEESGFVIHLEECPRCCQWLEEEAGEDRVWRLTKELLKGSHETERTTGLEPNDGEEAVDRTREAYPEIAFLAPSDDPAMLGRLGTYEIIGVLGRGGMGIVLKGFDRALCRNVAIKVLDPVLASVAAARQRFAREARAMAAVSHEHVVPVYAVDEHGSLPYFVMEYVPGGTLDHRLVQEGPLAPIEVVRVGMQVARALATAHRQGLVHRDIKPSNILLDQGTERVRVADFGLARATSDASFTKSGILAGTPQYMAPEQVRGEACDARSDLFSLGSLMYTLCVGHPPFRGETVYAVMQRIVHDQPRSLREQIPAIPAWLEAFILRVLAKEPAERFDSAEDVAAILEEELAYLQNPHVVVEPSRPWRTRSGRKASGGRGRWLRRGVLVGLAVVVAAYGAGWLLRDLSTPPGGDSTAEKLERSSPSPTAQLWDNDGFRETRADADALESQWQRSADESPFDPWLKTSQQIRERVAELADTEGL